MTIPPEPMISLTFDDALEVHLDTVIPRLNDHGLQGTFYAHLSAPSLARRFANWQAAAQVGHEIGNHTIFHPEEARKTWVRGGNALDEYFPDRMRLEVEVANQWLDAIDGGRQRSFAYPCANPVLGKYGYFNRMLFRLGLRQTRWPGLVAKWGLDLGNTHTSYVDQVADLFVAARISGLHLHQAALADSSADRYLLPSAVVEQHTFSEMQGFIERSLAAGGWPILQFHGVGGGHHMNCDLGEFEALVAWLAGHHRPRVKTVARAALDRFGPIAIGRGNADGA